MYVYSDREPDYDSEDSTTVHEEHVQSSYTSKIYITDKSISVIVRWLGLEE